MSQPTTFNQPTTPPKEDQNNNFFNSPGFKFCLLIVAFFALLSQIEMPDWVKKFTGKYKIENKKSQPPELQPDYRPEEPKLEHITKNFKSVPDWATKIRTDGTIEYKLTPPPGEEFSEEFYWGDELNNLVKYIANLRQLGTLYQDGVWQEVSPLKLSTIVSIAYSLHLAAHGYLVRALGKNYVVYVTIIEDPSAGTISPLYWAIPYRTFAQARDSFKESSDAAGTRFVGIMRIENIDGNPTVTDHQFYHGEDPWQWVDIIGGFIGVHLRVKDNPTDLPDYQY